MWAGLAHTFRHLPRTPNGEGRQRALRQPARRNPRGLSAEKTCAKKLQTDIRPTAAPPEQRMERKARRWRGGQFVEDLRIRRDDQLGVLVREWLAQPLSADPHRGLPLHARRRDSRRSRAVPGAFGQDVHARQPGGARREYPAHGRRSQWCTPWRPSLSRTEHLARGVTRMSGRAAGANGSPWRPTSRAPSKLRGSPA